MLIKCPVCECHSIDTFYNHKTVVFMRKSGHRGNFKPIKSQIGSEDHSYVCPRCGEISKANEFEVVS